MPLEAVIFCVDNSDWMRNGDYTPNRLEAQKDAINVMCGAKSQNNPENTFGVLMMAGKTPQMLVTLTRDLGKVVSALHGLHPVGHVNLSHSLQVGQLALKHREDKNKRQRLVVFVGSPTVGNVDEFTKLGHKLRKSGIALDVVNFGEHEANQEKLDALVRAANGATDGSTAPTDSPECHLITIPPGPHILSDVLISSPMFAGEVPGGSFGGAAGGSEFGIDPNLDPELALAIRLSLEEERQRQNREQSLTATANPASTTDTPVAAANADAAMHDGGVSDEEERLLQEALAMSMETEQQHQSSTNTNSAPNNAWSMLPGVDTSDPAIQEALRSLGQQKKEDKK